MGCLKIVVFGIFQFYEESSQVNMFREVMEHAFHFFCDSHSPVRASGYLVHKINCESKELLSTHFSALKTQLFTCIVFVCNGGTPLSIGDINLFTSIFVYNT